MTLTRDCMSDRIKHAILKRIQDGVYTPGDKLVELTIAREFNTSQAPVREALCELETMRVVETEPYKGTRVREITQEELGECLQVRGVLENLAAELVENRIKDQIDRLRAYAKDTLNAAKEKDVQKFTAANLDFHRLIVEASNNNTLIHMWNMMGPEVRMTARVRSNMGVMEHAANEHFEIIEAFAEGDNRFAGKLLRQHAEAVRAYSFRNNVDK